MTLPLLLLGVSFDSVSAELQSTVTPVVTGAEQAQNEAHYGMRFVILLSFLLVVTCSCDLVW